MSTLTFGFNNGPFFCVNLRKMLSKRLLLTLMAQWSGLEKVTPESTKALKLERAFLSHGLTQLSLPLLLQHHRSCPLCSFLLLPFCGPSQLPIPAHKALTKAPWLACAAGSHLAKCSCSCTFLNGDGLTVCLKALLDGDLDSRARPPSLLEPARRRRRYFSPSHMLTGKGVSKRRRESPDLVSAVHCCHQSTGQWGSECLPEPRASWGELIAKLSWKVALSYFLIKTFGEKFSPLTFEKRNT